MAGHVGQIAPGITPNFVGSIIGARADMKSAKNEVATAVHDLPVDLEALHRWCTPHCNAMVVTCQLQA